MTVYLDHNASAPLHPEVLDAMMPYLKGSYGNASSLHQSGRFLRSALESARQQVAGLVNASPQQVMFTSGGTEANNTAFKSLVMSGTCRSILSSPMEHASVLEPLKQLQQQGCRVGMLPVTEHGEVNSALTQDMIAEFKPQLISVQMANNETGVIQPLQQIIDQSKTVPDCLVHTDATQAIGKVALDFEGLDVDLMSLSGHKFNGPQGSGALIIKQETLAMPMLAGGPQESGRRAGTENVALLVGLGKAAEIAHTKLLERQAYLLELRRYFEQQLVSQIPAVQIFGVDAERLPNTSYFSIPYYHGETLLMQLDKAGFALASGSACHSEVTQPSHVLSAMGIDPDLALNAVRVSFGMENQKMHIDQLIGTLNDLINQLPPMMRQAAVS